jgi:membrane-associated phospholipid phosphatase
MRIITSLGSAQVFLILLPLVYWCYDEKKGIRLGAALLISAWINISLKYLLNQPRPFFEGFDPSLGMIHETMGGFPSGHAQNSLVVFCIAASWGKKKRLYCLAALVCLLTGFSRLYLGAHFPTDVAGGWLIGGVILCVYFIFAERIAALTGAGGFRAGMIVSAALALVMILYRPGDEALMPGGMMLGLGAGWSLNRRFIGFGASGVFGRTGAAKYAVLAARFVLGIACMLLISAAFKKIIALNLLPGNSDIFNFVHFAAAALWVSAGAPYLFCFSRLAESNSTIVNVNDID